MSTEYNSEEVAAKEKEYRNYIEEHLVNVWDAYTQLTPLLYVFVPELKEDPELMNKLRVNVLNHDLSKYSCEEFDAYRRYFYSVSEEEKKASAADFDKAWAHHYSVNPHHWNHWFNIETKECTPMGILSIMEMIIDWHAMGIKFGDNPLKYYEKNVDTIMLHPDTRDTLEDLLYKLYVK